MFAFALAAAAAALVAAGSGLVFFFDEWQLVLERPGLGPGAFLEPHNGQVFAVPVFVYKLLLSIFGMGSQLPFRLVAVLFVSLCSLLAFVYVKRRVGGWMALMLILPVMFLGAGWEALLLPLSINFLISLAAGLAMLLLLERGDRRSDVGASLALAASIASGGLGMAFAAGALADIALRREARRLWIVAVPMLAYALWLIIYGNEAGGSVTETDPLTLLDNTYRSIGSVAVAVSGFAIERRPGYWIYSILTPGQDVDLSRVLAAVVLVLVAIRLLAASRLPVSRNALISGAVLLAFWVMISLVTGGGRQPEASRYLYPGAVLLILVVAALLEGVELPRWAPAMLLPLVAVSVSSSVIEMKDGREFLVEQTNITRAAIGTVERTPGSSFPGPDDVGPSSKFRFLTFLERDSYLEAVERYGGSPGYTQAEIAASPPVAREIARRVVATTSNDPD